MMLAFVLSSSMHPVCFKLWDKKQAKYRINFEKYVNFDEVRATRNNVILRSGIGFRKNIFWLNELFRFGEWLE